MFEKCCVCKASTGIRGVVKSGFVSVKAAGLRKQENRLYLNDGSLWLCPHCLQQERALDIEAVENEKRIEALENEKRLAQKCREEKEWREKVDDFKCPEVEPYKTVWSWLYKNIGRMAKVEATIYDGYCTTLPIITDKWRIKVPDKLGPVIWSWHGEYQWITNISGKKHRKRLNGGYEFMKLILDINKVNRGFQTAEASDNTLTYKIGYAVNTVRDSNDEGIFYLRDPKDPGEISGWSYYSFTLVD